MRCSLPRTDPLQGVTNHNISAIVVRTRQSADAATLSRFIWYSAEPIVAPRSPPWSMSAVGQSRWLRSPTHSPSTELVQGIPCVRYDYAPCPRACAMLFFYPDTELEFGCAGVPLEIPSGGVIVSDDTGSHLGYTGTDTYFNGRVKVEYLGGIAITAWLDAAKMTNGVYELMKKTPGLIMVLEILIIVLAVVAFLVLLTAARADQPPHTIKSHQVNEDAEFIYYSTASASGWEKRKTQDR